MRWLSAGVPAAAEADAVPAVAVIVEAAAVAVYAPAVDAAADAVHGVADERLQYAAGGGVAAAAAGCAVELLEAGVLSQPCLSSMQQRVLSGFVCRDLVRRKL